MRTSEKSNEVLKAFIAAQSEIPAIARDTTARVATRSGREYTWDYASLNAIVDTIRPVLAKHGLGFFQSHDPVASMLLTRLVHASGEWLEVAVQVVVAEHGSQALSSAITYAQRCGLRLLFGLATESDDDANIADGNSAVCSHKGSGVQVAASSVSGASSEPKRASNGSGGHGNDGADSVSDGRSFFKWLCNTGKAKGLDLVAYVNEWAKTQDTEFPARIVDWDEGQVRFAMVQVLKRVAGGGSLAGIDAAKRSLVGKMREIYKARGGSDADFNDNAKHVLEEISSVLKGRGKSGIASIKECNDIDVLTEAIQAADAILDADSLGI